ncbi:tyrosine-type recombinase/integrase [Pseudanabaenaceae cyanobacterium LEGE 13415]|nr:tyrosine-type recombinase/integrase [Pseudanabaenaceae cyanobacterium LEGE 13415]
MAKVKVEEFQGNLRLRWSLKGVRHCITLGLADSPRNRLIAQMKADDIDRDIALGQFDSTLVKYKPEYESRQNIKVVDLFEKFIHAKSKEIYAQSLVKYHATLGYLKQFFREQQARTVDLDRADRFRQWLSERILPNTGKPMSATTLKERIGLVSACWDFAIEEKLLEVNPWQKIYKGVKPGKTPPPKPFTVEEIKAIIAGFRCDPNYSYYSDYVEFMLGTGCRPGEAIALRWKHVADDCSSVWIGEAYYRGSLKPTKTEASGTIPMSKSLRELLLRRKAAGVDPEDLVFPRKSGGYLIDRDFRQRPWTKVLAKLSIPYRKPYSTRSTLISYWLAQGEDPAVVAKMTRTSVKMIFQHYAGAIKSRVVLPDLIDLFEQPD